jgi:putative oxidoreductase
MKIATIIVRVLLGVLFLFGAVAYFFDLFPKPELTGALKTFNEGIDASGYLLTLIKSTELICGLAFLVGRFVPLASVIIFPVSVNILMVHLTMAPEGIPIALFVIFSNLFLAFAYRSHYTDLVALK